MTLVIILHVPEVSSLPEAVALFPSGLSRHLRKHLLLHQLMQPLWFLLQLNFAKLPCWILWADSGLKCKPDYKEKEKAPTAGRQLLEVGLCCLSMGWAVQAGLNFDLGLSWLLDFTHMQISVGLHVRLNRMSVCCVAALDYTQCWWAHRQYCSGQLEPPLWGTLINGPGGACANRK